MVFHLKNKAEKARFLAEFVENRQFLGKNGFFQGKIEWKPTVPVKHEHKKR